MQRRFFEQLESSLALTPLFEYLPEVYLYVKNRQSRFVKVNEPLWRLRGCQAEEEMIGLSDHSPSSSAGTSPNACRVPRCRYRATKVPGKEEIINSL